MFFDGVGDFDFDIISEFGVADELNEVFALIFGVIVEHAEVFVAVFVDEIIETIDGEREPFRHIYVQFFERSQICGFVAYLFYGRFSVIFVNYHAYVNYITYNRDMELALNDEMNYVTQSGVDYLNFLAFADFPEIIAGFAVRGTANKDYNWTDTNENYQQLAEVAGFNVDKMVRSMEQVHGADIARVDSPDDMPNKVDALITNVPGITLVMRVADCIDILMYDPMQKAIANVHSGWRGTLQQIGLKTVRRMQEEYGCRPEDIIAVLCPSIGPDHFEVTEEVRAQFESEFGADHIEDNGNGHFLIDAPAYVMDNLEKAGLKREKIHNADFCTVCNRQLINSYRGNIESEKSMRNAAFLSII